MTASLLQLVAIGSEDYYLTGNPQISHFKQIYMRYTNFSIERIQLYNEATRKISINELNTYNFKINTEYGDLLRSTYLHIKLPAIYCPKDHQFRWIKDVGSMIIEEAKLIINDTIIENLDSHSIHILNNITLNKKTTTIYNSVTGNIPKYYEPNIDNKYPYSESELYIQDTNITTLEKINQNYKEIPTIEKLKLYIPLPFFFNRFKILNIPICALRKSKIHIKLKLRPLRELYTIAIKKEHQLGINMSFSEQDRKLYTNKVSSFNPQSYKKYNNKTILDFIKDKNALNDIDISLFMYIIFLDKAERYNFSNNKYSALISVPVFYNFLGKEGEVDLKIENNNIVKEMYIFAQRDDVNDTNTWSNYSIYDYNTKYINRKLYQNYYYKLSIDQYDKDLSDLKSIIEQYSSLKNSIYTSGNKYEVLITYIDNTNNNVSIFEANVDFTKRLDPNISLYFDLLGGILSDFHSFLIYYGMFRKHLDENNTEISPTYFRYKILNSKNESMNIESLKYLPLFTVQNSFIKIDFINSRYTTSILDNTTKYIKKSDGIIDNDISNLLNTWSYRDFNKIPYINDSNIEVYDKPNIIKSVLIKGDGNPINNKLDIDYATYGKIFEMYNNSNIKNIIYYSFSEFPEKYQPSGHINFDLIKNIHVNLELKQNLLDKLDYKFNVYVYLMVYKILNIEKDSVSLLL